MDCAKQTGALFWKKSCGRPNVGACIHCHLFVCGMHSMQGEQGLLCRDCGAPDTDSDSDSGSGSWFSWSSSSSSSSDSNWSGDSGSSSDSGSSDSGGGDSGGSSSD